MGVAYRLPSINATVSVTIPAHSILISKSTLLLQAKGYLWLYGVNFLHYSETRLINFKSITFPIPRYGSYIYDLI